jgi:hypothetical protein
MNCKPSAATPGTTRTPTSRFSPAEADDPQAYGSDVTASTIYLRPQNIDQDRTCGVDLGIGEVSSP